MQIVAKAAIIQGNELKILPTDAPSAVPHGQKYSSSFFSSCQLLFHLFLKPESNAVYIAPDDQQTKICRDADPQISCNAATCGWGETGCVYRVRRKGKMACRYKRLRPDMGPD